jgi:DNA-binding NarL/FixJ family response regulator
MDVLNTPTQKYTSRPDQGRPRVLFVDDEFSVLEGVRRNLGRHATNWDVFFEIDPSAVLTLARDQSFDVVITDINMPQMSGFALLSQLREIGCQARFLILTGRNDLESAIVAVNQLNVFRYFKKPTPIDEIIQGISDAVAQDSAIYQYDDFDSLITNRVNMAALLLTSDFKTVHVNPAAQSLVRDSSVLVVDGGGICRAANRADAIRFRSAVEETLENESNNFVGITSGNGSRYLIITEPFRSKDSEKFALLMIRNIDRQPILHSQGLSAVFGFTPTESNIAIMISSGHNLKESADSLGLTLSTVRSYVSQMLQKVQVNRQADMVRLILGASLPQGGV